MGYELWIADDDYHYPLLTTHYPILNAHFVYFHRRASTHKVAVAIGIVYSGNRSPEFMFQ